MTSTGGSNGGRFRPHPGFAADAPRAKRFYDTASAAQRPDGYAVLLDGRAIKTPARRDLVLPSRKLAETVAAEWQAQGEFIAPATMPLTRLVNSALDGVTGREAEVRADIVKYAGSDLLCYLADSPRELVERQTEGWSPVLAWAEATHGIRMTLAAGVMPVEQDAAMLVRLGRLLEPFQALSLAGLHAMTTLSGSALLALATAQGLLEPAQAWLLAHIDEDFQIEQWGEDEEASRRRMARGLEMEAAALLVAESA